MIPYTTCMSFNNRRRKDWIICIPNRNMATIHSGVNIIDDSSVSAKELPLIVQVNLLF